jgi:chlorite dismutase
MNPSTPAIKRQYVNFLFFKIDPAWRRLPEAQRKAGRAEFLAAAAGFQSKLILLSYSTFGLRAETDFMLWRISYTLEDFEAMSSALHNTSLGSYLTTPYSFLSMTKRSSYVDKINPEHDNARSQIVPGKHKYLFVYPFLKTREWYLLPFETRQKMMDEHIRVGNKFPSVKLNTSYSFGLDDQEFVVAFETDAPGDFLDLVMALRETEGSRFTLRDTPILTCLNQPLDKLLETVA